MPVVHVLVVNSFYAGIEIRTLTGPECRCEKKEFFCKTYFLLKKKMDG